MKFCPECNFENTVNAEHCSACGHSFKGGAPLPVEAETPPVRAVASDRPNGSVPMLLGWIALGLSVICYVIALSSRPSQIHVGPYTMPSTIQDNAEALARSWDFMLASGGFFSLFLILWSVGYIVKAISFLPGAPET